MRYFIFFICLSLTYIVVGQDSLATKEEVTRHSFLRVSIAPTSYRGDLVENYRNPSAATTIGWYTTSNKRFDYELLLTGGRVQGSNANYTFLDENGILQRPNTFFSSTFYSFNFSLRTNWIKKENFKVYSAFGLGLLRFNPRDENDNQLEDLLVTRAENESFNPTTLITPLELGLTYFLSDRIGFGYSARWLNPSSDYIDNNSEWSINDRNDNILSHNFSLFWKLRSKTKETKVALSNEKSEI